MDGLEDTLLTNFELRKGPFEALALFPGSGLVTLARPGPGLQRSYIMLRVCEARAEAVRSCSDLATSEPCYSRCCEPWQAFHHHSATCRYAKSRHQDSLARSDENILNLQKYFCRPIR